MPCLITLAHVFSCIMATVGDTLQCFIEQHPTTELNSKGHVNMRHIYFNINTFKNLIVKHHQVHIQGSHYILEVKFKDFSRTFKDPKVAFSRTNSRRKFTAWTVLKQHLISISVIIVTVFCFHLWSTDIAQCSPIRMLFNDVADIG